MGHTAQPTPQLALVMVFDDLPSAEQAAQQLQQSGFSRERLELVASSVGGEPAGIDTPDVRETTASVVASGAVDGAKLGLGMGAGFGIAASILTASPGVLLAALAFGGLTGGLLGGIGGVDRADADDAVNLPTREEYQGLLAAGKVLLIVAGEHRELQRAHQLLGHDPDSVAHLHPLHGHTFHEHPRQPQAE